MKQKLFGAKLLLAALFIVNSATADDAQPGQVGCTISNWSARIGLDDAHSGAQGADNRRYAGLCGLRVPLDGNARFLQDDSLSAESAYWVRFYAFFDQAGAEPVKLFAARDGFDDLISIWYNWPSPGALSLEVLDADWSSQSLVVGQLAPGWQAVEVGWESTFNAEIYLILTSATGSNWYWLPANTSGLWLTEAVLGNLNNATGGHIDFDAFESRRVSRPAPLLRGDVDGNGIVEIADAEAIFAESAGQSLAVGQPDCNGDGRIDVLDALCVFALLQGDAQERSRLSPLGLFDLIFADGFEP